MSDRYPATIAWTGNTQDADYNRVSTLTKPGGKAAIPGSSGVAFGGDPSCWNPEDLLAAALANCHMLTFLALAHKVRLQVTGYEGVAESSLETVDRVSKVASIALRPTIRVAPGTDKAKVEEMFRKAHKYCVIGNSYNGTILLEPTVVEA